MFNMPNDSSVAGTAIASLVAVLACISSASAVASAPDQGSQAQGEKLAARVAAVAMAVHQNAPAELRKLLRPEMKIAQWRN